MADISAFLTRGMCRILSVHSFGETRWCRFSYLSGADTHRSVLAVYCPPPGLKARKAMSLYLGTGTLVAVNMRLVISTVFIFWHDSSHADHIVLQNLI
jgi:hypothetical protein